MTAPAPAPALARLVEGYRRTTASRSALALLLANAIPLVGVLFFGWSLWTILVLYWVENGVVGLWTVPRILLARGTRITPSAAGTSGDTGLANPEATAATAALSSAMSSAIRPFSAMFFVIHYGLFWAGHGFFVLLLPTFATGQGDISSAVPIFDPTTGLLTSSPTTVSGFGEIAWSSVALGAVALFVSHGASFFLNYLGRREYLRSSPIAQAGAPYVRVVVLHLTILIGGFAIAFLGAPIGALVVLVVLKTLFDLRLHLRQHDS